MLKENYRRVIYVDSPLDCPWRLGECGRHGCGNYSDCDYVYARHHPCEDEGVFPEDCPLDKVDKTKASKKVTTMSENIIIEMLQNVRGLSFLAPPGTILRAGVRYEGKTNPNGAICGLCGNGEWLGVKPGEFKFIEAPEWVLRIHAPYDENIKVQLGS